MLTDTMMSEAFGEAHAFAGLITVAGFFAAFILNQTRRMSGTILKNSNFKIAAKAQLVAEGRYDNEG